ncbi:MAG: VTT domain-containing protein [Ferruginibacter sp.]
MEKNILHLFEEYPQLAVVLSLCVSILIAVLGVLPSVFITAANIIFFGFWNGTLISFLGEAIGAGVAFLLYRKGFKKRTQHSLQKYPKLNRLVSAEGKGAFYLIFSLRLIPFVPSGLITFAAAIGSVQFFVFFIASSLGKLPALLLEAWSVNEVRAFGWQGKLILAAVAISLLVMLIKKKPNKVD